MLNLLTLTMLIDDRATRLEGILVVGVAEVGRGKSKKQSKVGCVEPRNQY